MLDLRRIKPLNHLSLMDLGLMRAVMSLLGHLAPEAQPLVRTTMNPLEQPTLKPSLRSIIALIMITQPHQ